MGSRIKTGHEDTKATKVFWGRSVSILFFVFFVPSWRELLMSAMLREFCVFGSKSCYESNRSSAGGLRCNPRFIARSRPARSIRRVSSSVIVQ